MASEAEVLEGLGFRVLSFHNGELVHVICPMTLFALSPCLFCYNT